MSSSSRTPSGRLVVLQSRPVTTDLRGTPDRPDLRHRAGRRDVPRTPEPAGAWTSGCRRCATACARRLRITSMATRAELRTRPLVDRPRRPGRARPRAGRCAAAAQDVAQPDRSPSARPAGRAQPGASGNSGPPCPTIARELVGTTDDALAAAGSLGDAQRPSTRRRAAARPDRVAFVARPRGADRSVERPGRRAR